MDKNFGVCPHCAAKGRQRLIRPATPHRTPLVSRFDGGSFHIFVEESFIRPGPGHLGYELVALFRYDLDSATVKGESALVVLSMPADERDHLPEQLEKAADRLAAILASGTDLQRQYAFSTESL